MFEKREPKGFGGWLVLLAVNLAVLGPGITIFNLATGVPDSLSLVGQIPGWALFIAFDTICSLTVAGLGLFAGIALWREKPTAVHLAMIALASAITYHIVILIAIKAFPFPQEFGTALWAEVIKGSIRGIFAGLVWLAYLQKSRRVANTFPTQPTAA